MVDTYCNNSNIQMQSKNDVTFPDDIEMQLNYQADFTGYQRWEKAKIYDIDNLANECIQESKNLESSNNFYYSMADKRN